MKDGKLVVDHLGASRSREEKKTGATRR